METEQAQRIETVNSGSSLAVSSTECLTSGSDPCQTGPLRQPHLPNFVAKGGLPLQQPRQRARVHRSRKDPRSIPLMRQEALVSKITVITLDLHSPLIITSTTANGNKYSLVQLEARPLRRYALHLISTSIVRNLVMLIPRGIVHQTLADLLKAKHIGYLLPATYMILHFIVSNCRPFRQDQTAFPDQAPYLSPMKSHPVTYTGLAQYQCIQSGQGNSNLPSRLDRWTRLTGTMMN